MYPTLLSWGPINIHAYGFFVALAFIVGIAVHIHLIRKYGLYTEKVWDLAALVIIFSIVGARFFYVVFFWGNLNNFWEAFMIWRGGLVLQGGLVFCLATVAIFLIVKKIPFWKFFDVITPGMVLGYAIGRIGCFFNGCCYGCVTNVPWAVKFPYLSGMRHPTQLYASGIAFIMFIVLLFWLGKKKFDGQIFCIGLIYYNIYRFFIEFIRVNPKMLFNLTSAQIISVIGLVISIWLYFYLRKKS
ncbi:MAG: prolipoprotein diacylglyceryl transferase [Candidatus Margulisbacteria bacterium]|nr:prolipoprotein diacylglyceryl transferase [Candidatus Margulisiibacteriota bacterium]MBU1021264.1 prolipoprotein diacylglyceryl transferase [Candidatus Margulisiibacteriota bacterium]MBU1729247.1 prolipoprotein diacylglyceryl transferase [Candidatus Margulisiibacteriota bacterium]MBU1954920.1 prolipoprotein diacylglyceryl transferase [Candidatus Margulisiibacteriota bacterium]